MDPTYSPVGGLLLSDVILAHYNNGRNLVPTKLCAKLLKQRHLLQYPGPVILPVVRVGQGVLELVLDLQLGDETCAVIDLRGVG